MRPTPGPRRPRTLADWLQALEASGWEGRKRGREWCGPCPLCGGEDRFHVGEGARVAVVAGCRHGCTFPQLAEHLFPRPLTARRGKPRAPSFRKAPNARRGPQNGSQAVSGASGGVRAGSGAVESLATHERHPPRGGSTPGIRPGMKDHAPRVNAARRLWERSGPVPPGPEHPARRWSARRNLWPVADPWPVAVRWLESEKMELVTNPPAPRKPGDSAVPSMPGGSLVAAFASLAAWIEAHPPAHPSGVQLVHVDALGRPRKDRGGLAKRSHGSMTGAVCVTGPPLWRAGRVHVAEGIADALAIAARTDGAAIAAGGTAGFARLAEPLAALSRPVTVWPDGDTPGRLAASRLALALRGHGVPAHVAPVPDGEDPASLAGPRNEWRQRA